MADCDWCGAERYRPGLLGPKDTHLKTGLRWICADCDRNRAQVTILRERRSSVPVIVAVNWAAVIITLWLILAVLYG